MAIEGTEKTTMSDHHTVLGKNPVVKNERKTKQSKIRTRNSKNFNGDGALKFLFFLEQKIMKLDGNSLKHTEQTSRTILECIDLFAPSTEYKKENPIHWIKKNSKIRPIN